MPRTRLSEQRLSQIKDTYIGNIIVFCEGNTEEKYFKYFADIIGKNRYANIEIVLRNAKGNSKTVLDHANDFLKDENNNRKYLNYGKYLVFDCDDPDNVQDIINDSIGYDLLISNPTFEVWLLMYFEDLYESIGKGKIQNRLNEHLRSEYKKGDEGNLREIIQNGDIEKAISNARALDEKYNNKGYSINSDIDKMDPFTRVYLLMEKVMAIISSDYNK